MPSRSTTSTFLKIVAALCSVYVMSQFFRSSNAVIAKDLSAEFGLSPEALGVLTGAFFFAFAAAQIPLGVMLDRYGPRRTVSILLSAAVAGAILYGLAGGLVGLIAGRVLLGIGCSGVLMSALMLFGRWVEPEAYGTWMGRMIAIGGVGGLLSTTPLAFSAETVGWRVAFFAAAAITAVGAAFVYLVVRDAPPGHAVHARSPETLRESLRGVGAVMADRRLPPLLGMALVSYPVLITILGLWGGPYLVDVHGLDTVHSGNLLLVLVVALIIGNFLIGPLERRLNTRKWLVVGCACGVAGAIVLLAVVPDMALWLVALLFVLIGGCSAYNVVVAGHVRSLYPDRLSGRGMALVAIALMGGPALMQSVTGLIIGAFPAPDGTPPALAYHTAFGFLAGCIVLALIAYLRVPDAKPSAGFAADERPAAN
jgi:MFS family permease